MRLRLLIYTMAVLFCSPAVAQDDGYFMELGLGGGGCFYMGDANSRLYNNTNGVFSILARYNINPRLSLKADLAAAGISGSSENAYGVLPGDGVRFSRTVYDLGVHTGHNKCNPACRLVFFRTLRIKGSYHAQKRKRQKNTNKKIPKRKVNQQTERKPQHGNGIYRRTDHSYHPIHINSYRAS